MNKYERLLADGSRSFRATYEGVLNGRVVRVEGTYIVKNGLTLLFNIAVNHGRELPAPTGTERKDERVAFEDAITNIAQWLSAKQFEESRKLTGFMLDRNRML